MLQADAILDRVSGIANDLKLANLAPQIAACRNLLHASNGIGVAVFGRFKAGKSSFLNHLVGRDVLPIGVVPLTAVITRLRYGDGERAEVRFQNGAVKSIPLGDIGLYVGENGNPENRKQVASVEVDLPALKPLAPLQFVDTPGLGSALTYNTEAALNWLPNVGAALVAVSADAPLSERDLVLLEELRRHTPRIGLLLTKADLLTERERREVMEFVREQLRRSGNVEVPVFFYSIKATMPDLKAALMEQLIVPLIQQPGEAGEQILDHKLASLAGQVLDYLKVALAAATQAESSRGALREKLGEERNQFGAFREALHLLAHDVCGQALDRSLHQLRPTQRALQAEMTVALQGQFPQWRVRLPAFTQAYGDWLEAFLVRELTAVSHDQRAVFCEPLEKARQHLSRALRAFQDRLAEHVQTALGLKLRPHQFTLEGREPEAPPVNVSLLFMLPVETVGWLVPMTLFRPLVERHFLRRARYEVEKNLSRLAAKWQERTSAAIRELRSQAEQYALNELATLEQVLAQTPSAGPRLRQVIQELEALHQHLKQNLGPSVCFS